MLFFKLSVVVLARYEPILLTLLKRREATGGALVKAKEQAQELKAQLRPLKEEIETLKLQRACLEEKLKLIHIQRKEDVGQYKVSKMSGVVWMNKGQTVQQGHLIAKAIKLCHSYRTHCTVWRKAAES